MSRLGEPVLASLNAGPLGAVAVAAGLCHAGEMSEKMTEESPFEQLTRGFVHIYDADELRDRLRGAAPLVVKAGFDPTRPDLHLGHAVLLNKMRQFQDLGHSVVFVVGDFTAAIGDPTGRNETRPPLSREQIVEGARTYAEQAFKVLDPARTQVRYNSEWLSALAFEDIIKLASRYTLARMLERDDFKKRWSGRLPISIHELLYPLIQAYDSVALKCDIELGGTDQLFNLMVGREIMRDYGLRPQLVMTTPILEGVNARWENGALVGDKMSKSLDNYVGLAEPPLEQFGKLMSINDALMWRYYELLSRESSAEIQRRKLDCESGAMNPKLAKVALATELVERLNSRDAALDAAKEWDKRFSQRAAPTEMREVVLRVTAAAVPLAKVLADAGLVTSNSEGRRRITQRAVHVDGSPVTDETATLHAGQRYVLRAGKHDWATVVLSSEEVATS